MKFKHGDFFGRFLAAAFLAKFPANLVVAAFGGAYANALLDVSEFLICGVGAAFFLGIQTQLRRPWVLAWMTIPVAVAYVGYGTYQIRHGITAETLRQPTFYGFNLAVLVVLGAFFPTVTALGFLFGVLKPKSGAQSTQAAASS
ncbi:MAG: hypothetical protein SFX74_01480 [Fimbriimonadaceae bacterium]|nr:hypothetical protein [Fimbriimonadaceae bacterium]